MRWGNLGLRHIVASSRMEDAQTDDLQYLHPHEWNPRRPRPSLRAHDRDAHCTGLLSALRQTNRL